MDLLDSLGFVVSGFTVVLVALALLWMISALIGRLFASRTAPAQRSAEVRPAPAPTGIPPAHLAAISAAVAVLTEGRGRIVTVLAPAHLSGSWASEGRSDQFSSHRVRWDWPPGRHGKMPDSPAHAPESKRSS